MWTRVLYFICPAVAFIHEEDMREATFLQQCYRKCFCDSFHPLESSQKVVGGKEAKKHDYPFLALLEDEMYSCGGSVITKRHILTAAHCVDILNSSNTVAQLKLHNVNQPAFDLTVIEMTKHPQYDNTTIEGTRHYNCDIAIAKVKRDMNFNNKLQPACLPIKDFLKYKPGNTVRVAGWGSTTPLGNTAFLLHDVEVSVMNHTVCRRHYKEVNMEVTNNMICAGSLEGGTDACQGDSGGPLLRTNSLTRKRVLIGIVSFGYGCAMADFPGVYTKVANFMTWIRDMIGDECLCTQN